MTGKENYLALDVWDASKRRIVEDALETLTNEKREIAENTGSFSKIFITDIINGQFLFKVFFRDRLVYASDSFF